MKDSFLGSSAVLEWRYSFSQAEMLLADNIPEKARGSYLALKAVVKTHINKVYDDKGYPHKIASYVLKSILFYEVEKQEESYWEDDNVYAEFFWIIFNALRKCIIIHRILYNPYNLYSVHNVGTTYFNDVAGIMSNYHLSLTNLYPKPQNSIYKLISQTSLYLELLSISN